MSKQGVETLVEIGPGKVLTGLTKRIDKSLISVSIQDSNSLSQFVDPLESFVYGHILFH